MRPLTTAELITVWEQADQRHPLERVLALLGIVFPNKSFEELAALPLGQRDTLLINLRKGTFGSQIKGYGQCSHCGERVEFKVESADLLAAADYGSEDDFSVPEEESLSVDGYNVRFRLPNSRDLAAIVRCGAVEEGHHLLLQRCVLEAREGEIRVPVSDLPKSVTTLLAAAMAERDPMAEIEVEIKCPACSGYWPLLLDIASFFWTEIATQAQRLLNEVHILARTYAWREADILAMSDKRRRYYLDRVS